MYFVSLQLILYSKPMLIKGVHKVLPSRWRFSNDLKCTVCCRAFMEDYDLYIWYLECYFVLFKNIYSIYIIASYNFAA